MLDLEKIKARRAAIGKADWSMAEIRHYPAFGCRLYLDKDGDDTVFFSGPQNKEIVTFIACAPVDIDALVAEAERLRQALTARIAGDTAAFEAVMAAYRLPRRSDEQKAARQAAIQTALARATKVPLETARETVAALELARTAARVGNVNCITDAGTAAHLARAAVAGAALNVRVNAAALKDETLAAALLAELAELERRAEALLSEVQAIAEERGGRV